MSFDPKEVAGRRAAEHVENGMILGLGTGSTVYFTLLRLKERIRSERIQIRGVPTSVDTAEKCKSLGIHLATLDEVDTIDLTIDGADEIDGQFNMIKGGGGALLREKVVASISKEEIIVVGQNKVVDKLGGVFPLPVEVVPFAVPTIMRALRRLGGQPKLRRKNLEVFITDNGNKIIDCKFDGGIEDPVGLELTLCKMPGVVDSGLFIGLAHHLVIGREDGSYEERSRTAI